MGGKFLLWKDVVQLQGLYFYVYSVLLRIVHSQQNQNQAQCQKL